MALGAMQNYVIYPAVFDALTINHMLSVGFSSNVQKLIARAGGSVDPAAVIEVARENEIRMRTGDIATVLSAVSAVNGLLVTSTGEIQFQQRADGGTYKTTSEHVTLNSTKGLLLPQSISASQDAQDAAGLEISYVPYRVGVNAPIIVNVNQSLVGAPAISTVYKLGPIVFENTRLSDIQDMSTNFGLTHKHWRGSGDVAAATGSIELRDPTMEFSGRNLELAKSIGGGAIQITNGITQYYRRAGYADNTSNHIAISLSGGTYEVTDLDGQGEQSVNQRVMVTGAGQISVSLGATIPT